MAKTTKTRNTRKGARKPRLPKFNYGNLALSAVAGPSAPFARALLSNGRRKKKPVRRNLFGFGGGRTAEAPKRRVQMPIGEAAAQAYKAGQKAGDTGEFRFWLERKKLDDRGAAVVRRLEQRFREGVEKGEAIAERQTAAAASKEASTGDREWKVAVRQAEKNLADAQKQLGAAARKGNQEAQGIIAGYESELRRVKVRSNPRRRSCRKNPAGWADIRPGDRVTIALYHGGSKTGRVVMRGPGGWVLNLGGAHGTPGIATPDNTLKVTKTKAGRSPAPGWMSRSNPATGKAPREVPSKQKMFLTAAEARKRGLPSNEEQIRRWNEAVKKKANPISGANSSGQGYDPDHAATPLHGIIVQHGYTYSHSTPVRYSDGVRILHTYKSGNRNVSVQKTRSGYRWDAGKGGSNRSTSGSDARKLDTYLYQRRRDTNPKRKAGRKNPTSKRDRAMLGVMSAAWSKEQKAFAAAGEEGRKAGRQMAASGQRRPTEREVEPIAKAIFRRKGLRFPQQFDGRAVFIREFYNGWAEAAKKNPTASDNNQTRFNRGFWDGVQQRANGRASKYVNAFGVKMSGHFDQVYAIGYQAGYEIGRGATQANAAAAWEDSGLPAGKSLKPKGHRANPTVKIGSRKVKVSRAGAKVIRRLIAMDRKPGKKNPETTATEMYKMFHGKDPDTTVTYISEEHEHAVLWGVGDLVQLTVHTLGGKEHVINVSKVPRGEQYPDPASLPMADRVVLAANEAGNQLYFVSGDQELDTAALGLTDADLKDNTLIGVVTNVVYQAKKEFHKFELTNYTHRLGEESGYQPVLVYHPQDPSMEIAGGRYRIERPGIID